MGTFFTPLEIAGPDNERFETVDALVDTGAPYTMLPAPLLRSLGVSPFRNTEFILVNGERIHREMGYAFVRMNGEVHPTIVVFSDELSHPILGAFTLEAFRLGVDTVNLSLIPVTPLGRA